MDGGFFLLRLEAINGLPDDAEKIALYEHFSKLVDYRDKLKWLQQLSKSEGCSQNTTPLLLRIREMLLPLLFE